MKAVNSIELIETLEQKVENHIQIAVKIFQNLSTDVLLQPSAFGGWSIAQCIAHLNSYGNFYLPHIKKSLVVNNDLPYNSTFKSGWLGNYFTQMMEPKSGKKYKAIKNHIPSKDLDALLVIGEFIQQQENLLLYLRKSKAIDLNTIKIPISISRLIKLKLGDVFQFLIAHNERHILQAKRKLEG